MAACRFLLVRPLAFSGFNGPMPSGVQRQFKEISKAWKGCGWEWFRRGPRRRCPYCFRSIRLRSHSVVRLPPETNAVTRFSAGSAAGRPAIVVDPIFPVTPEGPSNNAVAQSRLRALPSAAGLRRVDGGVGGRALPGAAGRGFGCRDRRRWAERVDVGLRAELGRGASRCAGTARAAPRRTVRTGWSVRWSGCSTGEACISG